MATSVVNSLRLEVAFKKMSLLYATFRIVQEGGQLLRVKALPLEPHETSIGLCQGTFPSMNLAGTYLDYHPCCMPIDRAHHSNLFAPLVQIRLVYADSIDPNDAFSHSLAQLNKGGFQVWRD